jgi:hypothetical protein
MIGYAPKRNIADWALFRLSGPYAGHPNAMRLQVQVKSFGRQPSEVRCQTQALKLALSVVFKIGHAHLLAEVRDRTTSLVLSVVHTTEQHPRVREGLGGSIADQRRSRELFCSNFPGQSSDNSVKAQAEVGTDRRA